MSSYWWVNQNKTYKHEVGHGYMWSPKRKANGSYNQFYENMHRTKIGDFVFSYSNSLIKAIGVVNGDAETRVKPEELDSVSNPWSKNGWYVPVSFTELANPIKPKDFIEKIRPTLPPKYSPLTQDGNGKELYLAEVPEKMASLLVSLLDGQFEEITEGKTPQTTKEKNKEPLKPSLSPILARNPVNFSLDLGKKLPHVIMFSWGSPQWMKSLSEDKPYQPSGQYLSVVRNLGMCHDDGRLNKIGHTILWDAYENSIIAKSDVIMYPYHAVVTDKGIEKLIQQYDIKDQITAIYIAKSVSGEYFHTQDRADFDWFKLGEVVSGNKSYEEAFKPTDEQTTTADIIPTNVGQFTLDTQNDETHSPPVPSENTTPVKNPLKRIWGLYANINPVLVVPALIGIWILRITGKLQDETIATYSVGSYVAFVVIYFIIKHLRQNTSGELDQEVIEHFTKAIELDPDNTDAQLGLHEAERKLVDLRLEERAEQLRLNQIRIKEEEQKKLDEVRTKQEAEQRIRDEERTISQDILEKELEQQKANDIHVDETEDEDIIDNSSGEMSKELASAYKESGLENTDPYTIYTEPHGEQGDYYITEGFRRIKEGAHEEAIENLTAALVLDPKNAHAYLGRGQAKYNLGQNEGSLEDYNQAIVLDPTYVDAYVSRGDVKFRLGRYEEALVDYKYAVVLDPRKVHNNTAYAAIEITERRIEWNQRTAESLIRSGKKLHANLNHSEAIVHLSRAIVLEPDNVEAYICRALSEMALRYYDEAIEDLTNAINLDKRNHILYLYRGNAYYEIGQYQRAIFNYDDAIRLAPSEPDAYQAREKAREKLETPDQKETREKTRLRRESEAKQRQGLRVEAEQERKREELNDLRLEERAEQLRLNQIRIQQEEEQKILDEVRTKQEAEQRIRDEERTISQDILEKELEQQKANDIHVDETEDEDIVGNSPGEMSKELASAYKESGLEHYRKGNFQEAIEVLNQSAQLDPENSEVYKVLGDSKYALGKYHSAKDEYTKAINLDPNYYEALVGRGICCYQLGEYPGAVADLEYAHNANPDDKIVADFLNLSQSALEPEINKNPINNHDNEEDWEKRLLKAMFGENISDD